MTKQELSILLDRLYGIDKKNQTKNLENAARILAEVNPPADATPRTADGVPMKPGDSVLIVGWDKIRSKVFLFTTGKLVTDGILQEASGERYSTIGLLIFSTFPAATAHIATLLRIEPDEVKPLPPPSWLPASEDDEPAAESEPMVPSMDQVDFLNEWICLASETINGEYDEVYDTLEHFTRKNYIKWDSREESGLTVYSIPGIHIRSDSYHHCLLSAAREIERKRLRKEGGK